MWANNDYLGVAVVACVCGSIMDQKVVFQPPNENEEEDVYAFVFLFGQANFVCADVTCSFHIEEVISAVGAFFTVLLQP